MKFNSLFYGIATGITLLALIAIPLVFGEDVTSSVSILGATPSVGSLSVSDDVDLSTCGTVIIECNATISDANGYNDIDTVNATLWDEASANEEDADNDNTHYTNTSCALWGGSGSTVNANCNFTVQYYANATDWTCNMYANDTSGDADNNSVSTITINTLRALDAENTISFSSLAPGATSTNDVNNTVINCGNAAIDLDLNGTNLTNASASVTNITVTNVKYNLTDSEQDYTSNMTSLTESPVTRNEFSLAKRISSESNQTTHWKISIPASIETLIYSGAIKFTAVADA